MQPYTDLIRRALTTGVSKDDRTGAGTVSVFGGHMSFDLGRGFPLLTRKYTNFRAVKAELLWMLSGSTNINDLDAHIWDAWADERGSLGPIYGHQWRQWGSTLSEAAGCDQIRTLQNELRCNPDSRRHIVSAWNVADLPLSGLSPQDNAETGHMALAPCHVLFQCHSRHSRHSRLNAEGTGRVLDLQVYQRSADLFVGVPFNIASYALLTHLLAQSTGHMAGRLHWVGGDCHVYKNHTAKAWQMLTNDKHQDRPLPTLGLDPAIEDIDDCGPEHIAIYGYDHGPHIPAEVAV